MHLINDKQIRQYLELSYGGAALQDSWALCDVGITSGSVIRCLIKVLKHQKGLEFGSCVGICRKYNQLTLMHTEKDAEVHLESNT